MKPNGASPSDVSAMDPRRPVPLSNEIRHRRSTNRRSDALRFQILR